MRAPSSVAPSLVAARAGALLTLRTILLSPVLLNSSWTITSGGIAVESRDMLPPPPPRCTFAVGITKASILLEPTIVETVSDVSCAFRRRTNEPSAPMVR